MNIGYRKEIFGKRQKSETFYCILSDNLVLYRETRNGRDEFHDDAANFFEEKIFCRSICFSFHFILYFLTITFCGCYFFA